MYKMNFTNIGRHLIKSVTLEISGPSTGKYACSHCHHVFGEINPTPRKCGSIVKVPLQPTEEDVYEKWCRTMPPKIFEEYYKDELESYKEDVIYRAKMEEKQLDGTVICISCKYYLIKPEVLDRYDNSFLDFWKTFSVKPGSEKAYNNLIGK